MSEEEICFFFFLVLWRMQTGGESVDRPASAGLLDKDVILYQLPTCVHWQMCLFGLSLTHCCWRINPTRLLPATAHNQLMTNNDRPTSRIWCLNWEHFWFTSHDLLMCENTAWSRSVIPDCFWILHSTPSRPKVWVIFQHSWHFYL